jgi:hypothetical protein
MTRHALPRKRVAVTLCGLVFVEWLLFELLRAPYRPPQDMTTFLGTEKYGVIAFMSVLAVLGLGLIFWWSVSSTWTRRDATVLVVVATVLFVAGSVVVFAPRWPVTPFHLLLR